jgi:hypothetical protein
VPCAVGTGLAAAESHIVVTNTGRVVFTPAVLPGGTLGTGEGAGADSNTQGNASPGALISTTDQGADWAVMRPLGLTWNPTDHAEYVDPSTGRLFFEDYGPIPWAPQLGPNQEGPAHIMWTSDGHAWHHTELDNLILPENPRFTSAPAPAGRAGTVGGYPDVTYFCANSNVGFTSPAIVGRLCFRSLDGGSSWQQTTVLFTGTVPQHPECGTSGEDITAIDGYYPEPMPDGSLYVLVSCGGRTYLARSVDEAVTFSIIHTGSGSLQVPVAPDSVTSIGSGPQLRSDPAGNLYLLYPGVGGSGLKRLYLRISSDRGTTWSPPLDITAPGVTDTLRWSVAERGAGQLAVAYLGRRAGQSTWDGYVTETRDALEALRPGHRPTLWSAMVNTRPLMYADHMAGAGSIKGEGQIDVPYPFPLGIQPVALGQLSAGNDFLGVTIAPDGSPWASFNQDCGPTPQSAGCVSTHDQTRGLAARLRWPS